MSENQEHQIQPDEHQGGLEQTEHTTQAARQDLQAQPKQTPRHRWEETVWSRLVALGNDAGELIAR